MLTQAGSTDTITYRFSIPLLWDLCKHSLFCTDTSRWHRHHHLSLLYTLSQTSAWTLTFPYWHKPVAQTPSPITTLYPFSNICMNTLPYWHQLVVHTPSAQHAPCQTLPEYLPLYHDTWWHRHFQLSPQYTPHLTFAWIPASSWHVLMAQPLWTITTLYPSSDSICMNSYCSILTQSGGTDSIFHTLLLVRQHLRENPLSHPHTWFRDHWPSPHYTPFHHTIPHFRQLHEILLLNLDTSCWHRHHYSVIPLSDIICIMPAILVWHKCITTVFTFSYIICITPTILSWHEHRLHICSISLGICHQLDTHYSVLTQAQTPYLQYFPCCMLSA